MTNKFFRDDSFHDEHTSNFLNKGLVDGDVDMADNSSRAVGTGAVSASGHSAVNVANGPGSVANQGGGDVNQAFGNSQVVSHSSIGQNAANSPGALQVGHDAVGAFNTGAVQGVQSGGAATGNVVGNGNETATVSGHASDTAFGFGHSTVGVASHNSIGGDGAISGLGSSHNQSHIAADHGSAVGGHDAFGSNFEDHHVAVHETNLSEISNSENVTHAQGHSFADADQHVSPSETHVDHSQVAGDDIHDFFDN